MNRPDQPDKPFPLWAVGTAGAIAGAGVIAGGVAAGLTLSDDKAGHPKEAKHGFLKRVKEPVLAGAQPAAAQSPADLLVGVAILSCCCILMLGIACVNFCSSKSPKDNRSLMAFSKVEEHEEQDEEDEAASQEDGLYIEEDEDYTGDANGPNGCGFTDGTDSSHTALLQNTVEFFQATLSPRPVDAE
jgi:hypothetical protein